MNPDTLYYELIGMAGLGFFGTAHCAGMCGPLVVAVPARHRGITPHLLYHSGRILTYTAIGAVLSFVAALLRRGGNPLVGVATIQVVLSFVAAAFLAVMGLSRMGFFKEPRFMTVASPDRIPGFDGVTRKASSKGGPSVFLWGLMLGALPCGLSYAAFAKALGAPDVLSGAAMVFAFGLGTLPGLLLLGTLGGHFFSKHRRVFDLISGAIMAAMAFALVTDGISALG